jgi:type II secretory pathway pseudopilin PulG
MPSLRLLLADSTNTTRSSERRAISLLAILVTLVIVILATLCAASTLVAMRATAARDRAEADAKSAAQAVEKMVKAAATHNDLKGYKLDAARKAVLEPALAYYQGYASEHANDVPASPAVAGAHFHAAGIQARMGLMDSVGSLGQGIMQLGRLHTAKTDPEEYPSVQECAMQVTPANEWMMLKGASFSDMRKHGTNLFFTLTRGVVEYQNANIEHPRAVRPRNELAVLLSASAKMQSTLGRSKEALGLSTRAVGLLDSLVKDDPANTDYKVRLAQTLAETGKLQKTAKDNAAAAESYRRAIEIREELLAANPGDATLTADLKAAKSELAKIKPAAPAPAAGAETAQKESPPADGPAPAPAENPGGESPAPTPQESAETPAAADAPGESTP